MAECRAFRRLLAVVTLLLLTGCGSNGESDALLIDYQQRLATSLGLEPPTPQRPGNIGAFPERRERLLEIPETRVSLLNVYALRRCHITNLVAQRNNQLGRVAPPSQQWLYELELWRRLEACRDSEVADTLAAPHRERLAALTATKADQLPRVSWNALFASEEWEASFSRASTPLSPRETKPHPDQLAALAYLREMTVHQLDPAWQPDSATLEGHLKALRQRPLTAEVLRTLLLAEQRLAEASALLRRALASATVCERVTGFTAAHGSNAEGARITAWLEGLETTARSWLGAIDALLDAQVDGPEAVTVYRRRWLSVEHASAPLPALEAARREHSDLRASLARRCAGNSGA